MDTAPIIALFLQGAALGLTAAASPGPFQTFLISESLAGGWQRGAPVAFAPLASDLPIILLTMFLLAQMPPLFLRVISLAGGLFVLYLAWGLWQGWRAGAGMQTESPANNRRRSAWGNLGRAVLVNFLSPGPYLFWALVNGPILLSALRASPVHAGAFVLGFYGVFICGLLSLAGLFHQARRMGPRVVRVLLLASIAILVVFGALLLKQGLWA
jgi:threonine/homoserine/homoserine lactone efflux protein